MNMVFLWLPVSWAIVATAIGLLLYRSSTAMFEERAASKERSRRIRLTGSVTIASLAFAGMWYATSGFVDRHEHSRAVTLYERAIQVDHLTLEAAAAASANDLVRCKDLIDAARRENAELEAIAKSALAQ